MRKVYVPKNRQPVVARKFPVWTFAFVGLWLFCLGSAFGVVYSTFQTRCSVQELESLRRIETGLRAESGQLQLEKSSLDSFPRVQSIAQEKLHMRSPESGDTVLVVRK